MTKNTELKRIPFCQRGQIVLVDFGQNEGAEQNGKRPALVIQNDKGNAHSYTTIVCPLTSKNKKNIPTHINIKKEECGLKKDSSILCEQIRVVDKSRILNVVAKITKSDTLRAIEKAIKISLALA